MLTRASRGARVQGTAVRVEGLAQLQKAFRRIGGELPKDTRRALMDLAEPIRERARANVSNKTGRHGSDAASGRLSEKAIKVGVTQRAVSVYSNAPHAAVQEFGGRVGHGALITRASASHYMTRAVRESRGEFEVELTELGSRIANHFERG